MPGWPITGEQAPGSTTYLTLQMLWRESAPLRRTTLDTDESHDGPDAEITPEPVATGR